jgi:hypothetical protein
MIVVDGYIGDTAERRVPARLYVEAANANIAGMQDVLYFHDPEAGEFEPELLVIYTPNLAVPGYPDDRLIAVNLDSTSPASSTPTTSASRRRAACACGTTSSSNEAAWHCTPAAR